MDSKIAYLNLAGDALKHDSEKVFNAHDKHIACKSCDDTFFFLSKKGDLCYKCFHITYCEVEFTNETFKIILKDGKKVLLNSPLSLLENEEQSFSSNERAANIRNDANTSLDNIYSLASLLA